MWPRTGQAGIQSGPAFDCEDFDRLSRPTGTDKKSIEARFTNQRTELKRKNQEVSRLQRQVDDLRSGLRVVLRCPTAEMVTHAKAALQRLRRPRAETASLGTVAVPLAQYEALRAVLWGARHAVDDETDETMKALIAAYDKAASETGSEDLGGGNG
jgi:chromosome segregation ATPase